MPPKPTLPRPGDRRLLRVEDLPPPGIQRWVIRRKADVVAAVRAGVISLEEACQRYTLSVEEFLSWQRSIDRHGLRGLRTTRLQDYRSSDQPAPLPEGDDIAVLSAPKIPTL